MSEFGDDTFADDVAEAMRIVVDLADLTEETAARELPQLIARARGWRRKHVSTVE